MNNKQNDDNLILSRRSFIKAASGFAGSLLLNSTSLRVSAIGLNDNNINQISQEKAKSYTDALEREVILPNTIKAVIPANKFAQIILLTLCPDLLVAVASFNEKDADVYNRSQMGFVSKLPRTGELYSKSGQIIDVKEIVDKGADIIIDLGGEKADLMYKLDYLQSNSGTATVFINHSFGQLAQTYRIIGELLNYSARAESLASYIEGLSQEIETKRKRVETSPTVLYAGNDLASRGKMSIQDAVIEYLGGTVPKVDREINVNHLLSQKIDYLVMNDFDCFLSIYNGEGPGYDKWSEMPAVKRGDYACAPALYHNWFGSLPLFAETIGLIWLGMLIWPNEYDFDIVQKVKEFYALFFNHPLIDEDVHTLLDFRFEPKRTSALL